MNQQHILLIGFKHTGKSTIGKILAKKIQRPFFDCDKQLETLFHTTHADHLNCREIMQQYGADYFKALETKALTSLINATTPSVIALGGSTPMHEDNQTHIAPHIVVHLTDEPNVVFERIMRNGLPAFFPKDIAPQVTFDRLWAQRDKVYRQLTQVCVHNDRHVDEVVECICQRLSLS